MFNEMRFLEELLADQIEERARQALQEGLRQGLEQGREQWLEQGREQGFILGQKEAQQRFIERILSRRFNGRPLPWQLREWLDDLSVPQLEALVGSALDAPDLDTFIAEVDNMRRSIQQSVPA